MTKPFKLYLRKGGVEAKAAWKNPSGVQRGFLEGWQYEIAAYRLDKLIGLNMIPPAVEREFQGKPGALVFWAENKYSLLKIVEEGIRIPDAAVGPHRKDEVADPGLGQPHRQRGPDPAEHPLHRGLADDPLRPFPGLPLDGEFAERLMFGRNGIKVSQQGTPWLFRRLPRWFVEKVQALTFENIKAAVGTTPRGQGDQGHPRPPQAPPQGDRADDQGAG